ncbi:MAG: hypothetical protein M1832_005170 [Thelocarpon impressellum]|nr:MAG: hypothetical protein M1832_005170 [Thelocarpon impressellum]
MRFSSATVLVAASLPLTAFSLPQIFNSLEANGQPPLTPTPTPTPALLQGQGTSSALPAGTGLSGANTLPKTGPEEDLDKSGLSGADGSLNSGLSMPDTQQHELSTENLNLGDGKKWGRNTTAIIQAKATKMGSSPAFALVPNQRYVLLLNSTQAPRRKDAGYDTPTNQSLAVAVVGADNITMALSTEAFYKRWNGFNVTAAGNYSVIVITDPLVPLTYAIFQSNGGNSSRSTNISTTFNMTEAYDSSTAGTGTDSGPSSIGSGSSAPAPSDPTAPLVPSNSAAAGAPKDLSSVPRIGPGAEEGSQPAKQSATPPATQQAAQPATQDSESY